MDAQTYFNDTLPGKLADAPDSTKDIDAVFFFNITGDGGGQWTVDLKADPPTCAEGDTGSADCRIEMTNEDFMAVLDNFSLSMQYFFTGKLKVEGDPMLATKLEAVLQG